jgi:hypothetical protein
MAVIQGKKEWGARREGGEVHRRKQGKGVTMNFGGGGDLKGQDWEGFQGRRNGVGGGRGKRVTGGKQGRGGMLKGGRGVI